MSSSEATSSDAEEQPGENVEYSEAKGDGTMYVIFGVLALVVVVVIVLLVVFFTRGEHEGPAMLNATAGIPSESSKDPQRAVTTSVPGQPDGRSPSGATRPSVPAGNTSSAPMSSAAKEMTTDVATTNGSRRGRLAQEPTVDWIPTSGTHFAKRSPELNARKRTEIFADASTLELITADPIGEKPGNLDAGGLRGSALKRSPDGNSTERAVSWNDATSAKLAEQDVGRNSFGSPEQPTDDDRRAGSPDEERGAIVRSDRTITAASPAARNVTPRAVADYQQGPLPSQMVAVPLDDIVE